MDAEGAVLIIMNRGEAQTFHAVTNADWEFDLSSAGTFEGNLIPANSVSIFSLDRPYKTDEQEIAELKKNAETYGFIESFRDISGHTHQAEAHSLSKLLKAVKSIPPQVYPEVKNKRPVYGADLLRNHEGVWGVTCGLYGLRSDRNWGVGDFEDLAVLAEHMASKGADFIGLNPVHALFPSAPHLYSPYSPSSREFLNIMHIAPDKIPELSEMKLHPPSHTNIDGLVDYEVVYKLKTEAFEKAFAVFKKKSKTHQRTKAFESFCKSKGDALSQQALFDALFETLSKSKQTYDGFYNFSKKYQTPESPACRKFEIENTDRITYYKYLQWIAQTQLLGAQSRAKAAGMRVGLYLDFAVGVVPGGSDAWREQIAFAKEVSLGAPGDMANPDGQKWNLLPFNPHALIKENFAPLKRALKANMELGGALRVDHLLGLQRSFFIPQSGGAGAYLRFPFDGLLDVVSELSHETNCVGDDFLWREALGIGNNPNVLAHEKYVREQDKAVLSAMSNLDENPESLDGAVMAKLQSWLASAPSLAFAVPLEDIMLDRQQPNVPGTTDEQPNWRRRSKLSLEALKANTDCNKILDAIAAIRPRRP